MEYDQDVKDYLLIQLEILHQIKKVVIDIWSAEDKKEQYLIATELLIQLESDMWKKYHFELEENTFEK